MYKSEQSPVIIGRFVLVYHASQCRSHAYEAIDFSVEEIAKRKGASMAQVALAWLLAKEGVTAPIIGPSSVEKLEDLLGTLLVIFSGKMRLPIERVF